MKLSVQAIKTILDIKDEVLLSEKEMARALKVTFYPSIPKTASIRIKEFSERLEQTLKNIGVDVILYDDTLESISFLRKVKMVFRALVINIKNFLSGRFEIFKFNFGKKVKKGIAVISIGDGETGNLPVDHVLSLRHNPLILIIDQPKGITEKSSFKEHLEASLPIFSWNISNIIISVGDQFWTVYSFNMSYPIHWLDGNFEQDVLHALVPKIFAPVIPPKIEEFEVRIGAFDVKDKRYAACIDDLVSSGKIFEKTGLYPEPKKINDLRFRNSFYRWLGSLLLDKRNGMSYGFIARQLPIELSEVSELEKSMDDGIDYFFKEKKLYISITDNKNQYIIKVPEVWVLTSRSGSDKTKLNPEKDIVKIGLVDGKMIMETAKGVSVGPDYKPSFDTRVILAHAVANAIFASIAKYKKPESSVARQFSSGRALAHWHGYFDKKHLPNGWYSYGEFNPSVSCSAPQGAVYAFLGKQEMFERIIEKNRPYEADIHIEPQHGSNVSYSSLRDLADFIIKNKNITSLGNEYLKMYL